MYERKRSILCIWFNSACTNPVVAYFANNIEAGEQDGTIASDVFLAVAVVIAKA